MKKVLLFLLLLTSYLLPQISGSTVSLGVPGIHQAVDNSHALGYNGLTKYLSITPKYVQVGSNLLQGWDFTNWTLQGATSKTSNTFTTTSGGGGIWINNLAVGRKYIAKINISTTSQYVDFDTYDGQTTTSLAKQLTQGYNYVEFIAAYNKLYLRNYSNGITTVSLFELYEATGSLDFNGNNRIINSANSDFESAASLGDNLLIGDNATFESGIGNWVNFNSGAPVYENKYCKLTLAATGSSGMKVPFVWTANKRYTISLKIRLQSGVAALIRFGTGNGDGEIQITPTSISQAISGTISPTINTSYLYVYSNPSSNGSVYEIDDVSIKEVLSDYSNSGNHTSFVTGEQKHGGSYALKIISTGAGDATANYVSLPTTKFDGISAGKKYTAEYWVYSSVTQNINMALGDITKTVNVTANTWTKLPYTFLATSSTVNQPLKIWASQASTVYVDDVNISEYWPFSFSTYFRSGITGTSKCISSKSTGSTNANNGLWLNIASINRLDFVIVDGYSLFELCPSNIVTDNQWHFVTVAVDASLSSNHIKMYLDGNLIGQTNANFGVVNNSQNFTIGKLSYANINYYNGSLGPIQILHNYAMTLSDHQQIYKRGHFVRNPYSVLQLDYLGTTSSEMLQDRSIVRNDAVGVNIDLTDRQRIIK